MSQDILTIQDIPLEICDKIFSYLDFQSKIRLRLTCLKFYHGLRIIDLYNIPPNFLDKLDDNIIKEFKYLKYLDASFNEKITDNSLKNLNLVKLNSSWNEKITDNSILHMTKLQILYAEGICGITDKSINKLTNIIELKVRININIDKDAINHLKFIKLKIDNLL